MPAYKDSKTGTWFVKFYCKDWTGENKQIKKRGFVTKREALDYERNYKIRQENNLDMTFGEFWKLYTEDEDIVYQISEDILQVIFDNLILNSVQQNENTQKLMITISINETNGFLNIKYCDNGKGLDDKYKTDPMKILEVHETTRTNGHGLGMWIVNNTCTMSGGEIQKICGEKGFEIEFTIGGKI